MAETLTGKIALQLLATLSNVQTLSTPTDAVPVNISQDITSGTGASQANKIFRDRRTLAASASESLNLYSFGGTLSSLGVAFTLSKVLAILIRNKAATASNLIVGGNGTSAAWTSLLGNNAYTLTVRPGGFFLAVAPDATGYAVVNTTNHLLKIANADGVNAVDYDIVIIGGQ